MAYKFKASKLKEIINYAEQELNLDLDKMNDHDLQTVALIKYQESNVFADEEPLLKEEQQDIDELMARAKKEEIK